MPLTDIAIRNAKPREKVVKLSDGGGLQLWIEPKGAKLWRLAYRFDGKQKKLAIGPYPAIDLRAARAKREEAKNLLREGKDPGAEKRLAKLTAATSREMTFEVVASELRAQKVASGKASTTIDKYDWHISLATPDLGTRPIAEISAAEVLAVLRKVEARGRLETARRLRSIIGQVFRFAMTTEPDFKNPNREPVTTLMDLARLDDAEAAEGYRDGAEGQPCGDNRSRSYWHGWRQGSRDHGHRAKNGDIWDALLTGAVTPGGRGFADLSGRIEACRKVLRETGEIA